MSESAAAAAAAVESLSASGTAPSRRAKANTTTRVVASVASVAATAMPSVRYNRWGSARLSGVSTNAESTAGSEDDVDDEWSTASGAEAAAAVAAFGPVVRLSVGGTVYATRLNVLRSGVAKGTFIGAMFSGRHHIPAEPDGSYFIDRDGPSFRYVINFLREPTRAFTFVGSRYERELALRDAEYYAMPAAYIDQLRFVDFGIYPGDGYAFLEAGKYVYCDGDARKLHHGALRRFGKLTRDIEVQVFAVAIRSSCVTKVACAQHTLGQAANLDGAIQLWFGDDKIASFGDVGVSESIISVVPLESPTDWLVDAMGEHGLHVRVTTWCGCRATAKVVEIYGRVRVPYDVAHKYAS
jgi:hypothetical protein